MFYVNFYFSNSQNVSPHLTESVQRKFFYEIYGHHRSDLSLFFCCPPLRSLLEKRSHTTPLPLTTSSRERMASEGVGPGNPVYTNKYQQQQQNPNSFRYIRRLYVIFFDVLNRYSPEPILISLPLPFSYTGTLCSLLWRLKLLLKLYASVSICLSSVRVSSFTY